MTATALDMTPLDVDTRLQELATEAMPHQMTLERANAAAEGKKVKAPTVEEIRAAEEALAQLRAAMNPLDAAYALRLWNRWYWVTSSGGGHLRWSDILTHWQLVDNDLADRGVDVWDRELMRSRPWPWLETRIVGLLSADTRLSRALAPPDETPFAPRLPG